MDSMVTAFILLMLYHGRNVYIFLLSRYVIYSEMNFFSLLLLDIKEYLRLDVFTCKLNIFLVFCFFYFDVVVFSCTEQL